MPKSSSPNPSFHPGGLSVDEMKFHIYIPWTLLVLKQTNCSFPIAYLSIYKKKKKKSGTVSAFSETLIKPQCREGRRMGSCLPVITTARSPTCTHWSRIDLCMRNCAPAPALHSHSPHSVNIPTEGRQQDGQKPTRHGQRWRLRLEHKRRGFSATISIPKLHLVVYVRFCFLCFCTRRRAALCTSIIDWDLPLHSTFLQVGSHVRYGEQSQVAGVAAGSRNMRGTTSTRFKKDKFITWAIAEKDRTPFSQRAVSGEKNFFLLPT